MIEKNSEALSGRMDKKQHSVSNQYIRYFTQNYPLAKNYRQTGTLLGKIKHLGKKPHSRIDNKLIYKMILPKSVPKK